MSVLELSGIRRDYGRGPVLDGLDLRVGRGEAVAILGPSGAGKSTLLNILGLLDRPDHGTYLLDGVDIGQASAADRARARARVIGFVFQSFHLLGRLPAQHNVEIGMAYAGIPVVERGDRARSALTAVGLEDQIQQPTATLSGGQQQRVAIARALARSPRVLLCDEPTGNLDRQSATEGLRLLETARREGVAVVVITHDETVAARQQRVLRLAHGRLHEVPA